MKNKKIFAINLICTIFAIFILECKNESTNNIGIEENFSRNNILSEDEKTNAFTVNNGGYYVEYNGYIKSSFLY